MPALIHLSNPTHNNTIPQQKYIYYPHNQIYSFSFFIILYKYYKPPSRKIYPSYYRQDQVQMSILNSNANSIFQNSEKGKERFSTSVLRLRFGQIGIIGLLVLMRYDLMIQNSNIVYIMLGKEINLSCQQCSKKQKLIEKYLNLIDLLKKKNDKSQLSTTKKSIDAGGQNHSPNHFQNQKIHLAYSIRLLMLKRKAEVFNHFKSFGVQEKCHKAYLFVQAIEKLINRKMIQTAKKIFVSQIPSFGVGHKESILTQHDKKAHVFDVSVSRNQTQFSLSHFFQGEKRQKIKNLTRRVFELTQELILLKHQKKNSDEQIQQNLRRQQVQSKKKKQSLEMLAEEMAEKNQVINELQAALKFYEAKEGKHDNNVLQQDSFAVKREIEKMEKINQKLSIELQKKTEHLQKKQEQLSTIKQKLAKIQTQYGQLKEKNFEMGIQLQNLEKKKEEYNNLSSFLQKKITNLKKYEKLISNNLKVIDQVSLTDKSSFNSTLKPKNSRLVLEDPIPSENNLEDKQNKEFAPITKFQNQYKIEKILNYLYNIDLEDVWINNEEKLFDNEELNVLNQVKLKFINLTEELKKAKNSNNNKVEPKIQVVQNAPVRLSKQCGQSDQIYFNQQHVSGSIFDVFNSEKGQKDKQFQKSVNQFEVKPPQCKRCANRQQQSGQVTSRKAGQGFTIKLLEMQIQKNKQIEKISQLKNKLFHIRSIVLNLIKSLEMKNLKPESKDIIDLCFEVFEYSEQEKQIIFHTQQPQRKQKKFLGLF